MSWRNQETVYVVMWRSKKTGATLSDLRKTDKGLEKLIKTLVFLGYKREEIIVSEQQKAWKPEAGEK